MKNKSVKAESEKTFRSIQQQRRIHACNRHSDYIRIQGREVSYVKKGGLKENLAKYFCYNDLSQDHFQVVMMSRKGKVTAQYRSIGIAVYYCTVGKV